MRREKNEVEREREMGIEKGKMERDMSCAREGTTIVGAVRRRSQRKRRGGTGFR